METLTREQEAQAFAIIRQGGPEGELALEQFTELNLPLIDHIARKYSKKGVEWDELRSVGRVGLLQAINRFDPERGLKFSTFAYKWIQGEIKHAFANAKRQHGSDCHIRATEEGVPLVFDDKCEVEDSSEEPEGDLKLEAPISTHRAEYAPDWGTYDLFPALEQALGRLSGRQRKVVAMHLGLCGYEQHTLTQIGKELGITAQTVHEIKTTAFKELQNSPVLQLLLEVI